MLDDQGHGIDILGRPPKEVPVVQLLDGPIRQALGSPEFERQIGQQIIHRSPQPARRASPPAKPPAPLDPRPSSPVSHPSPIAFITASGMLKFEATFCTSS